MNIYCSSALSPLWVRVVLQWEKWVLNLSVSLVFQELSLYKQNHSPHSAAPHEFTKVKICTLHHENVLSSVLPETSCFQETPGHEPLTLSAWERKLQHSICVSSLVWLLNWGSKMKSHYALCGIMTMYYWNKISLCFIANHCFLWLRSGVSVAYAVVVFHLHREKMILLLGVFMWHGCLQFTACDHNLAENIGWQDVHTIVWASFLILVNIETNMLWRLH